MFVREARSRRGDDCSLPLTLDARAALPLASPRGVAKWPKYPLSKPVPAAGKAGLSLACNNQNNPLVGVSADSGATRRLCPS